MKNTLLISSAFLLFMACQAPEKAELFIKNTSIIEGNRTLNNVGIIIRDGKIISVGRSDSLNQLYTYSEIIDGSNLFVYPGFIDAHTHFLGYGLNKQQVDLIGTTSWEEVIERCISFQKENQVDFIIGRGWDQNDWPIKEFPTNNKLDSVFGNVPVFLTRIDGHAAIANSAAMATANIYPGLAVEGGIIQVENGKCTGLLVDQAVSLIKLPTIAREDKIRALLRAQSDCFAAGLTTVDEAGLPRADLMLIDSLQNSGLLKIRIYGMVADSEEDLQFYMKSGPFKTDRLNIRSFKVYGDGALGSRGACLIEPYHDSPHERGFLLHDLVHFERIAHLLAEHGWQMNTHAIGDSTNRLMLQVYKDALKGRVDARWRIEHAQIINPRDFSKFSDLEILPSVQPTHATSDSPWAHLRLGPKRMPNAYNYKSLLKNSKCIALGTDFPVEPISPLNTFRAAVFRTLDTVDQSAGFQREGALSRQEALNGMTTWAAYSNFEEKEKGKIDIGFFGDFTILDTDLLHASQAKIAKAKVIYTIVNGEIVYRQL